MHAKLSILALALALVALGVAAFTPAPEVAAPSQSDARFKELESQVARLASEMKELNARLPGGLGADAYASTTADSTWR